MSDQAYSVQRVHPRYQLPASVQLRSAEETLELLARNLSLGGVLAATTRDLSALFPVGGVHDVLVFNSDHPRREPARVKALVVRHEPGGFALRFIERDRAGDNRLVELFAELQR